jgi:hypothetical protein
MIFLFKGSHGAGFARDTARLRRDTAEVRRGPCRRRSRRRVAREAGAVAALNQEDQA